MKIQRTFEISPNAQTETHVPQFTDLSNHDSAAESKPNGVISTLEKTLWWNEKHHSKLYEDLIASLWSYPDQMKGI